jgi:tetratricopeptide (TPR) repeat protein
MRYWHIGLVLFLLFACDNESGKKSTSAINKPEIPEALQKLIKKQNLYPDSIGLRLQLIDAYDSIGNYTLALGHMDSLLLKDSLNYGLWYRKALLQENAKDTAGALKSYKYAIRVYPAPDALLAAANLLAEQKNPAALELCKQVSKLRMGREYTAHCFFISGVYYARIGDSKKALLAFNQCIYNDLYYMEAYMEKGFIYFDSKKTADAAQVFQTVITLKNTYADGYYWLAKCEEVMNNQADAINNYQKAFTLNPKLIEAQEALKKLAQK